MYQFTALTDFKAKVNGRENKYIKDGVYTVRNLSSELHLLVVQQWVPEKKVVIGTSGEVAPKVRVNGTLEVGSK